MKTVLALALALAAAASAVTADDAAVHSRTCSRSNVDKTLNSCIRHNIQAYIPHVKDGGKFGLPRLEPYLVPEEPVKVSTGLVDVRAVMQNFTVHGLSEVVVRDAMADLGDNTMRMDVDLFFPNVTFTGMADVTGGQILAVPLKGRGFMSFSFSDLSATWRVEGKRRAGEKHMFVESVTPTYTVGRMRADIRLLDNKIPNLEHVVNAVVNHYWDIVVDLGKPFVQKALAHHMQSAINTVFQNVPYDHMFPA